MIYVKRTVNFVIYTFTGCMESEVKLGQEVSW